MICPHCSSEDCERYTNCYFCFSCEKQVCWFVSSENFSNLKEILFQEAQERHKRIWKKRELEGEAFKQQHSDFIKSITIKPSELVEAHKRGEI